MTVARSKIVDPKITPWYHCISKCVRGASLIDLVRKQWIEDRLQELVEIFAIDVASFSVLDNHFHILVHLDLKSARRWSKAELLRRWARLYPPRDVHRRPLKNLKSWIEEKQGDHQFISEIRDRLVNLGWFMKSLKEPLARLANEADGSQGAFWSARYKSIAIIDELALLATCVYIDLNPLAAGMVSVPEQARHTSLYLRIEHCRRRGRLKTLEQARRGATMGVHPSREMETGLWLCPLEDRRGEGSRKPGVLQGFSLGNYLLLLDETSRYCRPGKARVAPHAKQLLERLGTQADTWKQTLEQLFSRPTPRGVAFAFSRKKLRDAAKQRGCHHIANLNGCPAR